MKVQASAGRERTKDLRDHCYRLVLTAQTEEEERALASLCNALCQEATRLSAADTVLRAATGDDGPPVCSTCKGQHPELCSACGQNSPPVGGEKP